MSTFYIIREGNQVFIIKMGFHSLRPSIFGMRPFKNRSRWIKCVVCFTWFPDSGTTKTYPAYQGIAEERIRCTVGRCVYTDIAIQTNFERHWSILNMATLVLLNSFHFSGEQTGRLQVTNFDGPPEQFAFPKSACHTEFGCGTTHDSYSEHIHDILIGIIMRICWRYPLQIRGRTTDATDYANSPPFTKILSALVYESSMTSQRR